MSLTDAELLHGDPVQVAAFLDITPRQLNNYRTGKTPLPGITRRLLQLRMDGDLAALMGDRWEGFRIGRDGLLYVPGWANGMRPEQIRAMFFVNQEAAALRSDVRALRLGNDARHLQRLRELVRIQPSNDRNAADDAQGDVLRPIHA